VEISAAFDASDEGIIEVGPVEPLLLLLLLLQLLLLQLLLREVPVVES
jgi:hypothetical protein